MATSQAEAQVRQGVEHCRVNRAGGIRVYAPHLIELVPDPDTNINFWGNPRGMPAVTTGIHNHYVSFESDIVLGALTNRTYRVLDDPEGPFDRFFLKRWYGADNQLQYAMEPGPSGTPRARTELLTTDTWHVGDRYALHATEYHSSAYSEPTISLVHIDRALQNQEVFLFLREEKEYEALLNKRTPKDDAALDEAWDRIDAFMALL